MLINELFGKTITNIYAAFSVEEEWLDRADCVIEVDNTLLVGFPYGFDKEVLIRNTEPKYESIFKALYDYPVYFVNKENKSIREITDSYQKKGNSILSKIKNILFGCEVFIREYQPYKVEYKENKTKHILNSKIIDFIWYDDESEKGLFLLDNGFIITETTMSPSGTGAAGLNYYESFANLIDSKGPDYSRLSNR